MRQKIVIIVVLLLGSAGLASAQYSFNSLDSLWQFALAQNSDYRLRLIQVEQARQDKRAAQSFLYPTVSAAATRQDNIDLSVTPVPGELLGKPGETVNLQFGKQYNYTVGLAFAYDLLNWQKIYQSKVAQANLDLQRANSDYFEQSLKEQIGQIYYASLTALRASEIGKHDLAVADTLLQLSESRFAEGTIDGLELNQARTNRYKIEQQLCATQQYEDECLSNLKILAGLKANDQLNLEETLQSKFGSENIPGLVVNSAHNQVYKLQAEFAEAEQKKAGAAFLPDLQFHGFWGANQFQDELTFSFESADWNRNSYIGLSLSIPIFNGLANRSNYRSSRLKQEAATLTYANESRKTAINDQLSYRKMISSQAIAQSGEATFKLSAQNLKLASSKYSEGLISMDAYLKVFDDYLAAESSYLNSLSDFLSLKVIFESRKQ